MMEINGGMMPMRRSLTFKASEIVYVAASLILKRYAADLDDPCTQKLEAILAGFGCQVCPAGIARLEANFNNILFRLVIVVFTQYIVI